MSIFQPLISFSKKSHLGMLIFLLRCQGEITEEIFKMIFPLLISITITKTLKMRDNRKHIMFHFLLISMNIYITFTKVKFHRVEIKISVQEIQILSQKSLFSSKNNKAPNRDLWRSDLLLKCYEIFIVTLRFSYEPNASNGSRNRL